MLFFSLLMLIVLLLLSAFFSAAETAFTSLTNMQINIIKAKYQLRGRLVGHLYKKPHLLLSTILVGNNAANFIFSVQITSITLALLDFQILAIISGIMIFVILIFGEIIPKQVAIQFNQQYIVIFIVPLLVFHYIFFPIAYILSLFINRSKNQEKNNAYLSKLSTDQFITLFYQARDTGSLEADNVRMITRVLSISQIDIDQIAVHRKEVMSVSSTMETADIKAYIKAKNISCLPVYKDKNKEHIIGILTMQDIYTMQDNARIETIMKTPLFITEHKHIDEVLDILRNNHETMAIILDEYGGLQGIVTIDDIISYIFDALESSDIAHVNHHQKDIMYISKNRYLLKGRAEINDICEIAGMPMDTQVESRTISGYIAEITGELPTLNKSIDTPYGKMSILEITHHNITSVLWVLKGVLKEELNATQHKT